MTVKPEYKDLNTLVTQFLSWNNVYELSGVTSWKHSLSIKTNGQQKGIIA